MADLIVTASKDGISYTTSTKTLIQLAAPTNQRLKILEVGIFFKGTSATDVPILVQLCRQTTAGTMSSLTGNNLAVNDDEDPETVQTTAQHTASAEPTTTGVIMDWTVHPQTGLIWVAPPHRVPKVKGGGKVGLLLNTPAQAGTAAAYIVFEE